MRFVRLTFTFALIFSLNVCLAQDTSALRKWQDSTGTFSIEARMIQREGDIVVLEQADGVRAKVPLARLSKADQVFLANREEVNPFAATKPAVTEAEQVSVIVWLEANGQSIPQPAYVLTRNKKEAIVVFERVNSTIARRTFDDLAPVHRVMTYRSDGSTTQLPCTLLANKTPNRNVEAVVVASELLPNSFSGMKRANPKIGDPVKVAGFEIDADSVSRLSSSSKINKLFRNRLGAVARIDIAAVDSPVSAKSIVTDSLGRLIGIVGKPQRPDIISVFSPTTVLASFAPNIISARAQLKSKDETSFTYTFSGTYSETFERTTPSLMIYDVDQTAKSGPVKSRSESPVKAETTFETNEQTHAFRATVKLPKSAAMSKRFSLKLTSTSDDGLVYEARPFVTTVGTKTAPQAMSSTASGPTGPFGALPVPETSLVPITDEIKKRVADAKRWVQENAPKPMIVNQTVASGPYALPGLKATQFQFAEATMPVWAADGKAFYLATRKGVVRRITYPGFVETHRLETKAVCESICISKSSVVVALSSVGEVLVLSPEDLTVRGKIDVSGVGYVSGSAMTDLVYAGLANSVEVIDLNKLRVMSRLMTRRRAPNGRYNDAKVTPDGKFVFSTERAIIHRYRVEGNHLKHEQSSESLGSNPGFVCVCADSKHVALPCGGGNQSSQPGMPVVNHATFLFSVDDLSKPDVFVQSGSFPRTIEVDPKSGDIYTQSYDQLLTVFNGRGSKRGEFRGIAERRFTGGSIRYAVHPAGGSLFVQREKGLIWIEIPEGPLDTDAHKEVMNIQRTRQPAAESIPEFAIKDLKPRTTNQNIAGPKYDLTGLKAKAILLRSVLSKPVWAADGKAFYACTKEGVVSRIKYPDFIETHRLKTGAPCESICITKKSVVVSLRNFGKILVLSPGDLSVKSTIDFPLVEHVSGSAASDLIFSSSATTVKVIESDRGRLVTYTMSALSRTQRPTVTPDGKFVFTTGGGKISRYRVVGDQLEFEESSLSLGANVKDICVCADSKHVALPCGSGNQGSYEGNPRFLTEGTYLFGVGDLSKPKVSVDSGSSPNAIEVDPKTGAIYTQNHDHMLLVFSRLGSPRAEYRGINGRDVRYAVHPAGGSILVHGNESLLWVEVPEGPIEKEDGTIDDSEWLKTTAPKPTKTDDELLGKRSIIDGNITLEVELAMDALACEPVFSGDGKRLYTVTPSGVIQIIEVPKFRATLQIDLGASCTAMALTAEGLLVAVPGKSCAYLLDSDTLTIKRRMLTLATQVAGCPTSSIAFGFQPKSKDRRLTTFDLKNGRPIRETTMAELSINAMRLRPGGDVGPEIFVRFVAMTANGKYLLTAGNGISRFRIEGGKLLFEQATRAMTKNPLSLMVSVDGKLTALPDERGNIVKRASGRADSSSVFVLSVDDLSQPTMRIDSEKPSLAMAVDPVSGNIYTQTSKTPLIVLSSDGVEKQQFASDRIGKRSGLIAYPLGSRVLVLGEDKSTWVEIRNKK